MVSRAANSSNYYLDRFSLFTVLTVTLLMKKKTYTFDEAFAASLDYFQGDELAAKVWVSKYA